MNDYGYWSAKLRGENPDPPTDDNSIRVLPCGFWRRKDRSGVDHPLAVWIDARTNDRCAVLGNLMLTDDHMAAIAESGSFGTAIFEDVYRAVARGEPWPDVDATVAAQVRGIGDNRPPQDPAELLKEQIEAAKAGAGDYAKIADDNHQARALSLKNRLLELAREADKTREALKKPHLEAGKAVDETWMPLVRMAKVAAADVGTSINAYETEKYQREREAQRAAEEAQREAEEAARESDATLGFAPPPAEPPPPAAPKQIKPGYGRAHSTKVVMVIKTVTDWPAVLTWLSENQELRALALKLATRAVNEGQTVPGVIVEEIRKVG